ncbi:Undecaprenyl-phosphate galactose phosphotransferase [Desulfatibacillum aliphaticivorans]|uniref:Undecaprenyl-phosphate galactose phosphotransferase n=1 Tax=Desulfatibacillum aliphaticivorans TaxID=218208 RepID=B8F9T7_DESAL|nr:sugar transferase [Desulfatibacillum aliphaticivorans]ACL03033.1 Undecaprenyl-phosphate galactose phosphotransferase [Desulfatibacillum aliphaticivorans]
MRSKTIKRMFDIFAALFGLILLSPLLLTICLAILVTMGFPIFYRQVRPEKYGRPFEILKFRTMNGARYSNGDLLPDSERITSVGRFLRTTSMDELPQLINVLNGDMSIVGPRPLLIKYLDLFTPEQARRQSVKPGITGWAQVNGRNLLPLETKIELDVWYVDNWNLWLDMQIIYKTFWVVLKGEGVQPEGFETMEDCLNETLNANGCPDSSTQSSSKNWRDAG